MMRDPRFLWMLVRAAIWCRLGIILLNWSARCSRRSSDLIPKMQDHLDKQDAAAT